MIQKSLGINIKQIYQQCLAPKIIRIPMAAAECPLKIIAKIQ